MSQSPLPTDPISSLFSDDTETDGAAAPVPTRTFYGSRQIFPPCPLSRKPTSADNTSIPTVVCSREAPPDSAAAPIPVPHISLSPWRGFELPSESPPLPATLPDNEAILDKFPITAAWLSGVLVGVIAHSLARGDSWKIGRLQDASGPHVIWLRPGATKRFQAAAWLVSTNLAI